MTAQTHKFRTDDPRHKVLRDGVHLRQGASIESTAQNDAKSASECLHFRAKTEGKISTRVVFEPQVHTDLVSAFWIMTHIINLENLSDFWSVLFGL
ncbi:MAG: hypothetical protein ACKO8Z_17855 [Prosthecobacter sp.]